MNFLRPIFGLILTLVLTITSVTMAVARQYGSVGTTITICADGGETTVTLDAQGNRIPFAHPCPDCVAAVAAQIIHPIATLPTQSRYRMVVLRPIYLLPVPTQMSLPPQARAPPYLM
jgi:hypothetical protein